MKCEVDKATIHSQEHGGVCRPGRDQRTAGVDIEAGSPEAMRLIMADPVRSGIDLMDRIGFRPQ